MLKLLKYLLHTLLQSFLTLLILLMIVGYVIRSIPSLGLIHKKQVTVEKEGQAPHKLQPNTLLTIKLEGHFVKHITKPDPFDVEGGRVGISVLQRILVDAAKNDKIKGVYLEAKKGLRIGLADLHTLLGVLRQFKSSGKKIFLYAWEATPQLLFLRPVVDRFCLHPSGGINLGGQSMQSFYYKNLFEMLRIRMVAYRTSPNKTAVEPFISDGMSDHRKERMLFILNHKDQLLTTPLLAHLKMSRSEFEKFRRENPFFMAQQYELAKKIVDQVATKAHFKVAISQQLFVEDPLNKQIKWEESAKEEVNFYDWREYKKEFPKIFVLPSDDKPQFVILSLKGTITRKRKEIDEGIDPETVREIIPKILRKEKVKGLVVMIDSPGGDAGASESIYAIFEHYSKKYGKPIIRYINNVGASGGFYIACSSSKQPIICHPYAMTLSIGVFSIYPNLGKFLKERLGINSVILETHPLSAMGTPFRMPSEEEKQLMNKNVMTLYDLFVQRVATATQMQPSLVKMKTKGGVVALGFEAEKMGLVKQGTLKEAVDYLANKMNLKSGSYHAYFYTEPVDWVSSVRKLLLHFYPEAKGYHHYYKKMKQACESFDLEPGIQTYSFGAERLSSC